MIKTIDITSSEGWISINVCSDSLSALTKLKSVLSSLFLFTRIDLEPSVMNLSLKTAKLFSRGISIRFTWCSAHIGNEMADMCAKTAGKSGTLINNLVSRKSLVLLTSIIELLIPYS